MQGTVLAVRLEKAYSYRTFIDMPHASWLLRGVPLQDP